MCRSHLQQEKFRRKGSRWIVVSAHWSVEIKKLAIKRVTRMFRKFPTQVGEKANRRVVHRPMRLNCHRQARSTGVKAVVMGQTRPSGRLCCGRGVLFQRTIRLAARAPHSVDWLLVLPISLPVDYGLKMRPSISLSRWGWVPNSGVHTLAAVAVWLRPQVSTG